jgi:hypothetical protein
MPEPYFFFCYSRADLLQDQSYIESLFDGLRLRIATTEEKGITPDDPERHVKLDRVGFRDQTGVQHGEAWKAKIGKAIQHSGVLVCLYSPNFFSRNATKQFCGREFTAFLLRNRDAYYVKGAGDELQLRGARNIIPILWEHPGVMRDRDPPLPPYVLHDIQCVPALGPADLRLVQLYQSEGLRAMARRHPKKFGYFVDVLAERIRKLAREALDPLPEIPEIEKLRSAFWEPPHDAPLEAAVPPRLPQQPGPQDRRRIDILVAEVRLHTEADPWFPYVGEDSLAAAIEQFINRLRLSGLRLRFDTRAPDFVDNAVAAISNSSRALFVLDPRSLSDERSREAVMHLLSQRCCAGLLVPADAGDTDSKSLVEAYENKLQTASQVGDWVVRIAVGAMADFHVAADAVAADLLARIVAMDPVRDDPPENSGPTVRPRMTNRLEDRQAA